MNTAKFLEYFTSHSGEMVQFLEDLVLIESPTYDAGSQQAILNKITGQLTSIGYSIFRMPGKKSGGFIMARPNKRQKTRPVQLIIGHCDTVWPKNILHSMPLKEENGMIRGPGIFDMKAGLTQIVFALKAISYLKFEFKVTPVVLINSDEERGSFESTPAIIRLAKIAKRAYILEPPLGPEGRIKTARKGIGRFTLTVKGKPAHAGLEPGKGVSAILELSHQIQKLFHLNDYEKGITVNVGMIEGGMNPNVVAPFSNAIIDVRVMNQEDGDFITKEIHSLKPINPETELIIDGSIGRPPMEKTPRNRALWVAAKKIGGKMGIELMEGTAGGGSDGNTTSQYTATLDGLGTPGDGAHAEHEFIYMDKLLERTALLCFLLLMD